MTVDLVPRWVVGEVDLTSYPFSVDAEDGVEIGEPELVVEEVVSNLADGDDVREVRHGNRTYVIHVFIEGATLGDLAVSEALLRTELKKASREGLGLLHDPGDGLVPASVYQVRSATMTPERRDSHEAHLIRKWTLTLTCAPFARSAEPVTVDAMVAGATTVTVDSCDSTTGWSGSRSGSGSPALGIWTGGVGVVDLDSAVTSPETWTLTRTGTVDLAVTPFLVVEARTVSPTEQGVEARGDGANLTLLSVRALDTDGWMEFIFQGSAVVSELQFVHTSSPGEAWQGLIVREISRTDIPPNVTSRQLTRIIEVGGTERTPANIHVQTEDGTGSLDLAIAASWPEDGSGFSPPLRRWRNDALSTGPETTSSLRLSGFYEPLVTATGGFVAEVPTAALPEGGYVLMGLIGVANVAGGSPEIFWSTSTIFPDSTTQQGYANGSVVYDFPDDGWYIVPLAALSLPSVRTSAGKVQIVLQVLSHPDQVLLDEAWLFRADEDCALTIVKTERPHLWLNSADTDSPVPTVWVGDGSDTRVHPGEGLLAMGAHVLSPDGTAVFTASMSDNPATDATFYRRWHSNAAS